MKIGITYNLKEDISPEAILSEETCEEFDALATIDAICGVFEKNGHETVKLGSGIDIAERIKREGVEFVFNIAEGYKGRNRESHVPAVLEMLGIPYSGSDPLTLGLTLDKTVAKKIMFHAGLPTPRYRVVHSEKDIDNVEGKLQYPLITKPTMEGSSKGIYNSSKALNRWELERSVKVLFERYPNQPILVEEYIAGREITVGVIGNESPRVLGVMEIINKVSPGKDFFYSLDVKRDWKKLVDYTMPEYLEDLILRRIKHYAITAFKEFGSRDISRIDFRVTNDYKIFLLEINPLPGLSPEYADLVIMAKKYGIEYDKLILSILEEALSRYKEEFKNSKTKKGNEK